MNFDLTFRVAVGKDLLRVVGCRHADVSGRGLRAHLQPLCGPQRHLHEKGSRNGGNGLGDPDAACERELLPAADVTDAAIRAGEC